MFFSYVYAYAWTQSSLWSVLLVMMTLLLSRWSQSPRFALGSSCCKSEGGQCIFAFFYTQNKPVFRRVPISFQPTGMVEATLVAKRAHFEVLTWQTLQVQAPTKKIANQFSKVGTHYQSPNPILAL